MGIGKKIGEKRGKKRKKALGGKARRIITNKKMSAATIENAREVLSVNCLNRVYDNDSCKLARKKRKNQSMCKPCSARIADTIEKIAAREELHIIRPPDAGKGIPIPEGSLVN